MDVDCAEENDGYGDFHIACDVAQEEVEPEPAAAAAERPVLFANAVVAADADGELVAQPPVEASAHIAAASAYAKDRQATSLLPLALTLPAVLHIVHNLLRE
eukprot:3093826-Heterocapsa_arctica.AAC.1